MTIALSAGLAVVVPHHTRRDLLVRALGSVRGWPVIVVDDSDAGGLVAGSLPGRVRVVRTAGSVGFSRAVNAGLAAAQAAGNSLALVLNDDAEVLPGCIEALLAVWATGVGALGPVLEDTTGAVSSAGFRLSWWGRLVELRQVPAGPSAVAAVSGAAMLLSTETRFDEDFAHGMEDLELCQRLLADGQAVLIVPGARCRHVGGATVSRRSPAAQRHAVSGHLRLVGGGWRTAVVLGLAAAQVVREGGPAGRFSGIVDGFRDYRLPKG